MPEALNLYTIPPHRAFADALANGLIQRFGADPMALARGIVLLPNNRAKRAIQDAFVRASGGGLLLPRLVAVGDPELDEAVFEAVEDAEPVPPADDPGAADPGRAPRNRCRRGSAAGRRPGGNARRIADRGGRTPQAQGTRSR